MGFYLLENSPVNGTQWQQWAYPRRGIHGQLSGTCIIHTSESALDAIGEDTGAEGVANFIANRTGSYGSYHDIVDSDSIIEMAPFEYETWQDSETNNWAVGISAACRTTDWATMGEAKREGYYRNLAWCAADFVKYMRTKGIEVQRRRISGAEARARVPGFCAHGDSGIARTDPGADFDWNRFFRYIEDELNGVEEYMPAQQWYDDMIRAQADIQANVKKLVAGDQTQVSYDGLPNPYRNVIKGMRTDVRGVAGGELPVKVNDEQLTALVAQAIADAIPAIVSAIKDSQAETPPAEPTP